MVPVCGFPHYGAFFFILNAVFYTYILVSMTSLLELDLAEDVDFRPIFHMVQWNLDLRKPDLRKNLDLRKIVGTTNFLVHKLFDLRKIF